MSLDLAALVLSCLALWLGWRSDQTSRKAIDELKVLHQRESDRVEKFIDYLMKQGGDD
jgi:hypothetical protein